MTLDTAYVGRALRRVDGRAKVTGEAKYAAEPEVLDLLYGDVVSSAITRGKIKAINAGEVLKLAGVVQVFTHENRPSLPWFDRSYHDEIAPSGSPFRPLYDNSVLDHRFGRFINHDFAEYHVPVNADVREIDVIFVEEHDEVASPIGVKGLGKIGVVGVAAAIGNAVFHATGRRIRDLPITLDKLL